MRLNLVIRAGICEPDCAQGTAISKALLIRRTEIGGNDPIAAQNPSSPVKAPGKFWRANVSLMRSRAW